MPSGATNLLAISTANSAASTADPKPKNKLVVIGHSFGASVTFNALAHVYLERFLAGVYSIDSGPRFRGYGDLVVLINPAIEAMRYMPFQSAVRYYAQRPMPDNADFSKELLPRLVVLSSESDFPTRRLFPLGRVFSTFMETHRGLDQSTDLGLQSRYSEWAMDRSTVGNFEGFHTHDTVKLASTQPSALQGLDTSYTDALAYRCKTLTAAEVRARLTRTRENHNQADEDGHAGIFEDSGISVYRKKDAINGFVPYMLANVDEAIVDGHNDIVKPNLVCWINQLLDTKEPPPPTSPGS